MGSDVFIAGMGCISAIGTDVESHQQSLIGGLTGVAPISLFDTIHKTVAGEVKLSNDELYDIFNLNRERVYSRTTLLGLMAAVEAYKDAGLDGVNCDISLVSATSVGGMDKSEQFYCDYLEDNSKGRLRYLMGHDCGSSTQIIYNYLNLNGLCTTVSTACSSANNAIGYGAKLIKLGIADVVIAGGTDALCRFTINGFSSLGILDSHHCKPFDANRRGLNLGEGAAFVVLVSDRVKIAKRYCKLVGFSNANDAFHQTASSSNGEGAYLAMKQAIELAKISPFDIDYINVHGTGTENNDASEYAAMQRIFNDKIPLYSSTKGYTGHALAAAGALESVFSILALKSGFVWPSINYSDSMEGTTSSPNRLLKRIDSMRLVMTNSFGFGGNCTTLIYENL